MRPPTDNKRWTVELQGKLAISWSLPGVHHIGGGGGLVRFCEIEASEDGEASERWLPEKTSLGLPQEQEQMMMDDGWWYWMNRIPGWILVGWIEGWMDGIGGSSISNAHAQSNLVSMTASLDDNIPTLFCETKLCSLELPLLYDYDTQWCDVQNLRFVILYE
jgi:hypothetical protein